MAVVLHHSQATGTAKVILLGIANHDGDGGAWPTIETLTKYANVSDRSVQNALRQLEESGEVITHRNGGGTVDWQGNLRPNRYQITVQCPEGCDRSTNHRMDAPRGVKSATERGEGERVGGVKPPSPKPSLEPSREPSELLLVSEQPPGLALVVAAVDPIEAQFAGFWEMYPRKVGKPAALKAFRAALRRATVEDLAAGLRAQLPDLTARDRSLVPHPTTWLNQDRWADDPQQARQAPQSGANHYLAGLSPDFQAQMQQGRAL